MIDWWLVKEPPPPRRWVKITGRYLYRNFARLMDDCYREQQTQIIIDRCPRSQKARGYLFCVETDYYRQTLSGTFRECDDASGNWIEYVLYRRLRNVSKSEARLFAVEP